MVILIHRRSNIHRWLAQAPQHFFLFVLPCGECALRCTYAAIRNDFQIKGVKLELNLINLRINLKCSINPLFSWISYIFVTYFQVWMSTVFIVKPTIWYWFEPAYLRISKFLWFVNYRVDRPIGSPISFWISFRLPNFLFDQYGHDSIEACMENQPLYNKHIFHFCLVVRRTGPYQIDSKLFQFPDWFPVHR